ncbi:FIST C domain protein [Tepidimonas alkaliphilus]|uniref:FIST C domain protein n=1 Tax=Tepidimonas alkaliphilus TaxID=2588942 RepID=A0A554W3X2_9BURK|nr:FIST C-terminal domain-containing protein [Tepidimonas alkaliphilus]TSE18278.1 FIST C domain protein [Tepidimonas alkaliphilus]
MRRFVWAHAGHDAWATALEHVLAQLRAQMAMQPAHRWPLGWVYLTDHHAGHAAELLRRLSAALPQVTDWVGGVALAIGAGDTEYFDAPGLADLEPSRYRVFNGVAPLPAARGPDGFVAQTALVHADPSTPELPELIQELAERTLGHYVFGGLVASRAGSLQIAHARRAGQVGQAPSVELLEGGLSGVAFAPDVGIVARVTQGVRAVTPLRRVTAAQGHRVDALDGRPALDVVLEDLGLPPHDLGAIVARLRGLLVGWVAPAPQRPQATAATPGRVPLRLGEDVLVRHLVGLDPAQRAVVVAEPLPVGAGWTLCERHVQAARADLLRIGAEIREALAGEGEEPADPVGRIAGAIYVSCNGRGGPHFGAANAEWQLLRQALGDVPAIGFFAAGEIAHHRLYGYTGVLTVFVADEDGSG